MGLPKLTRKAREREQAEQAAAEVPMTRLEERREQLREKFAQLQWDLGGAAYEMAARDYFRLDVLTKIAARLQTVDAELAEIERMARLEAAGASGSCPGCGSLYAQGAVYCWRCGRDIHASPGDVVGPATAGQAPTTANGQHPGTAGELSPAAGPGQPHPGHHRPEAGFGQEAVQPDSVPDPGFDPAAPVRDAFPEADLGGGTVPGGERPPTDPGQAWQPPEADQG